MTIRAILIVVVVAAGVVARGEDKGACPPAPPPSSFRTPKKPAPPPDSLDKTYVGTVTLLTVISDTGYVCSAQVLHGIDKKIDADALNTLRKWHFRPALKRGRPLPVVTTVDLGYWRDKEGKLVHSPSEPSLLLTADQ